MINYVRKDLSTTKWYHFIALVVSMSATGLLCLDRGNYSFMGLYICLATCFTYIIGQSCFFDEKGESKNWIKTLPHYAGQIVDSKFVLSLFTIAEGSCLYLISNLLIATITPYRVSFSSEIFILMGSFQLAYIALFLYLFYRYSYSIARSSMLLMLVALLLTKMIGSGKYLHIPDIPFESLPYIALIAGVVVFILSWLNCRKRIK